MRPFLASPRGRGGGCPAAGVRSDLGLDAVEARHSLRGLAHSGGAGGGPGRLSDLMLRSFLELCMSSVFFRCGEAGRCLRACASVVGQCPPSGFLYPGRRVCASQSVRLGRFPLSASLAAQPPDLQGYECSLCGVVVVPPRGQGAGLAALVRRRRRLPPSSRFALSPRTSGLRWLAKRHANTNSMRKR